MSVVGPLFAVLMRALHTFPNAANSHWCILHSPWIFSPFHRANSWSVLIQHSVNHHCCICCQVLCWCIDDLVIASHRWEDLALFLLRYCFDDRRPHLPLIKPGQIGSWYVRALERTFTHHPWRCMYVKIWFLPSGRAMEAASLLTFEVNLLICCNYCTHELSSFYSSLEHLILLRLEQESYWIHCFVLIHWYVKSDEAIIPEHLHHENSSFLLEYIPLRCHDRLHS